MSTSDRTLTSTALPETGGWAAALPVSEGAPPGVLSPAELARIANELFAALPDEIQQPLVAAASVVLPPNSAFTGNPYAAVPSPTAPAAPGILASQAEAQPGTIVAAPERSIAPDTRSSASAAPAVPGSGVAAPAFGFLQDARPLFQEPAAEPGTQQTPAHATNGAVPSDEGFASIPFSLLSDIQPSRSAETPQPPAPAVPGALGVVDSSAVPAFSFMEDARPLFSTPPTIPGPVPAE